MRCAAALRDELRGLGVEIRAGLHTGEVELRDRDIGGIAVHIAARVMAAAGPGEILTSRTVRDLVVGSDITLNDRGPQPLKGVEGTWQLFTLVGRR
jgi:class 3 adenylate cyclase